MSPPSHQSGRFDPSGARSSSPRLAAQYNLEHDPLQSDRPQEESRSLSFLRELATGGFASSRFSAGILLVVVLGVMVFCFWQATMSVTKEVGGLKRSDPSERAAELPPQILNFDRTEEEVRAKTEIKSGTKSKPKAKKKPAAKQTDNE